MCDGILNGPLVALMDDSCPAGRRSDVESMNASVGGETGGDREREGKTENKYEKLVVSNFKHFLFSSLLWCFLKKP